MEKQVSMMEKPAGRQRRDPPSPLISRARKSSFPGFVEPCHPTAHVSAPTGERWVHEIKVDGYRCQLHVRRGSVKAFTRRGYDWATRFRSIADAAKTLPVREAIIDGEVIVP